MITQKASGRRAPGVSLSVLAVLERQPVTIRAAAPTLMLTVEAAVAHVRHSGSELTLDRAGCLLLPSGAQAVVRALSSATRVAALALHPPLVARTARSYRKLGLERALLEDWLRRPELLPRTVWMHEIVHRYLFERYTLGERDNLSTRFLEMEIVKEIYFLFRDREAGSDRATLVRKHSACVERAIAYVESHLFEPCEVRPLAAFARVSRSTLLRACTRELGFSPAAYWRNRKLDEALVMVRSGSCSVAEIAAHVGYDNATAFGYAFRHRFGRPPSAFRPRRPIRPSP